MKSTSRRAASSLALAAIVALALVSSPARAATSTFTFETNYVATGIDQWGSTSDGYANSTTYQNFFGTTWDESIDFGGFSYGLFGEKYGFKGNAFTNGKVGLDVYFKGSTGSVDIHSANTVNLEVSNLSIASGATGLIHVNQNKIAPTSGNTLTSVFPTMEFSVDATFQIDAGVSGEFAYGVGSSSGTVDLADVKNVIAVATLNPLLLLSNPFDTKLRILSYNLNNSHDVTIGLSTNNTIFGSPKETLGLEIPVLNLDSPAGLRLPLSLGRFMPERRIGDYDVSLNTEVEFGNVVLHSPYALDLASGVGNVASGHQDQIIGLAIDPIGIATLAAGFPINPLAPKIGIPGTPLSVEATLLEAQLQLDMGLNQTLTFAPNTYVRLLSNYDVTYSINGQTVTSSDLKYLLPSDGSDFDIQITGKPTLEPDDEPWTLTPTVYSTPTLQNTLDLNFSTSLDVTAGELGLVYEGLIPLPIIPALYHENFPFGDLGAINLINRTLTLGNLTEFQQVYRSLRPLVGGAVPKDFSVLLGEYIVDDEVSGTFKAQPIAGTLILTNSSFDNATALEVPGTFQLKGQSNIAGSAGLTVTGALKIDKGSRFIDSGTVDANGDPLLDGNGRRIAGFVDANGLVSSGTFNIAGRLSYEGADIDKIGANAKFILVGDPADPTHPRIDNGGADAFAHLHWIDGSLSLTNLDISTDQLLVNHGTLALLGDSNLTARGYDSNAAANLAIAGGNVLDVSGGTFGRVDAAGALTGFNAALGDLTGASIIYNGFGGAGITAKPGITSNSGDLILSGTRPANGYIIRTTGASTFVDGLATLAANSGTLVLANGATQTLTGSFSNTKTVGITMPTTPAVPVAPFTTLTVAGGFTNFKDVIIDGGILAAGSFTQTSTGLLQLTRGAEVNLTGAIGGLSGSGNTTLGSGKWYLDGTVTYTGNPIVTIGTDTDVRISGAGHGFALNDGSNAYRNLAVNNGYFVLSSGATAASTVAFSNTNQLTVNANSSFTTRGLTENSGNISIVQTGSYDTTGAIPSLWASTNSIPLTPAGLLTGGGTTNVAGTLTFSGPAPSGGSGSPLTGVAAGTTLAINHTSLYAPTNTSYVFNEALVSRNPTTGAAGNGFANFSTIAGTLMLSGGSGSRTDASLAVIGGGLLTVDKGSTLQITGASFTTIPITLNSDSHVIAGTVLNGNLILGGGANTTTFSVPDNFVFSGTTQLGREVLKASGGVSYYETTGKGALSSAASWTNNGEITGVGNVKGHSITNTGVIYATGGNVPAGDALLIDNSAGTGRGAITNTGNIGSGGNGLYSSRLTISGMDIANSVTNGSVVTKGQLFASSNLDLQHSTVTGGFVNIAAVTARDLGTGVTSVTARGRLSLLDSTLTGVTLTSDGYIDILNDNGGSSTIGGTILLKPAAILTVRGNGATGATLIVGSGSTFTNTGTIRLEDGANFSGSTITNQALITIAGGRTGPLDNIDNTINGIVTLDHGTNLQLNGAFSNAGRIELSGESATEPLPGGATISHSTITLLGNATLSGGGILQLGGYNTIGTITASNGATIRTTNTQWRNGANDLGNVTIVGTAGTEVLTISNQTLSGQGLLGNGTLSLINDTNGTIRVLGNGSTLAINTNSSGFTNRGTLDIGAGSTMSITGGTFHSFTPAASGANAILAQGRYRIAGTLAINGLTDFDNAANIVFSGSNVHFTDQIGNERVLLNNLATGSLEVRDGAAYSIPTTAGRHFTNAGTLVASAG
ncbi:MAG: beta strand repeat-containing protein, partial [Chthoniobacterales bacterium]